MQNILKKILKKFQIWSEMIKIEHTVFSAPFMLVSLLLAKENGFPSLLVLFWAALALTGARASAMTLNRLIDAQIDALNPRTKDRAIPTGTFSKPLALLMSILGFALMLFSAYKLNKLCLYLSPVAIFWLTFYSYVKRFSYLCHFALGLSLSGAVIGGWIAITGSLSLLPCFLALGVCFWVAGFDILYAIQDRDFDLANNVHSIPAKFGIDGAIVTSSLLHVLCELCFLACLPLVEPKALRAYFLASIFLLMLTLIWQNIQTKKDLNKINSIFFWANAVGGGLFLFCVLLGKLIIS